MEGRSSSRRPSQQSAGKAIFGHRVTPERGVLGEEIVDQISGGGLLSSILKPSGDRLSLIDSST